MFGNKWRDQRIEALEGNVRALGDVNRRLVEIEEAFNELFEAVAADLGYQAKEGLTKSFGYYPENWAILSPHRLVKRAPLPPEVVRNPTARCKDKK